MAVVRNVFCYFLFIAGILCNCTNGTTTGTPAVSTVSTAHATTTITTTMTATTKAMTTQSTDSAATTTKPKTTGPPMTQMPPSTTVGNWTLKDDKGKICMRMSFAAQMNVSYIKHDESAGLVVVNVNPRRADVTATCKSGKPGRTLTVYPFSKFEDGWTFELTFSTSSGKYSLTNVGTSWVYDSRFVDYSHAFGGFSSENVGVGNFLDQSVTLGKSYSCVKPLTVVTGEASLQLWDMNLQPFAEDAGGKFGEAETCHATMGLIVIIAAAVGAFVFIVVVSVVVIVVVKGKRKRAAAAPYSNF